MTANQHDATALLEKTFGFRLPAAMKEEFNSLVAKETTQSGQPLSGEIANDVLCKEYISNNTPFELTTINFEKEFVNTEQERLCCTAVVKKAGETQEIKGFGNGALNALVNAFKTHFELDIEFDDYSQHSLTRGSHALAASYIHATAPHGRIIWGVGIDSDSTLSAVRALLSGINRSLR
jgi:2-isopropylmalate synthase